MAAIQIHPIPAFDDNYIWCLHDKTQAYVVDPGDADPVFDYLQRAGLTLAGILVTHHHFDHTGGIDALLGQYAVPVYGPDNPAIAGIDHPLTEGDTVACLGLDFRVLAVPGHTLDHIAYFCAESEDGPLVFCGDTLFAAGCGRLFEGDPQTMLTSLTKLAELPDNTRVYCTHEYTLANLAFARAVEPENTALHQRSDQARQAREQNRPTLPSTLAQERATNPFLRADKNAVIAAARQRNSAAQDPVAVFAEIRRWKDRF